MSGNVLTSQSTRAGDYQESAIVNGHPSWINANHAIWFVDDFDEWAVGGIEYLGTNFRSLAAESQGGSVCPFDIDSTNWYFWNGEWTSAGAGEISIICSQDKGNNNNINIYRSARTEKVNQSSVSRTETEQNRTCKKRIKI